LNPSGPATLDGPAPLPGPDTPADGPAVPLAVIGIGCLFPGAEDLRAFWSNIVNGVDGITEVPPTHWRPEDYHDPDPRAPDRVYTARGGFLRPVPFNPGEFGIAPNNLEAIDTAQLLGLLVARQALADAGYAADDAALDRGRTAVILGVTGTLELVIPLGARLGHPIWRRALREAGVEDRVAEDVVRRIADSYVGWQENSFPGLLGNVVAGRIANRLDLGGTNCVVDAACASSLSALHLAALELATGRADVVLTGGADTFNDVFMYTCFSKTPALSPTGDARPFDASGDGTILGEGLGMVVLKRLADARRDGDRIYAVIRGIGSSSDGKGNAVYAPRAEGQMAALRRAYHNAGVGPDTVELVEAHGTGTRVGDATEVAALTEVYRETGRQGTWCALGSIKSQIGHTKAAAGAAGLIKAIAALHHKVLPPTIKVGQPLDALQPGRSPFYVNTEKRPWLPADGHPRRAALSAFGFGGSNFHCVVEEADPHKAAIDWDGSVQILAFSGDGKEQLLSQLADWPAEAAWEELCLRAAESRAAWRADRACRLILVVERDRDDLGRLLAEARSLLANDSAGEAERGPEGIYFGRSEPAGKLAVLFPGQGAQYVGMLRDLACHSPAVHDSLAEANRAYREAFQGPRLSDLIYPPPAFTAEAREAGEAALRATQTAQPALGAVCLGAWRALEEFGVAADAFAGHSFGELTALTAAGRMDGRAFFDAAVARGRLMAESGGPGGAMLAVLAPSETIDAVLWEEGLDLVRANKNAPQQTVLSGRAEDIDRAAAAFAARHVRAQRLAVSAAFHSPLVADAEAPFRSALANLPFPPGRVPVYANTTAAAYPDDPEQARNLLARQLARPVEFVREIENLYQSGVRTFLEVGPGARLTGLVGAILRGQDHDAVALDQSSGRRSGFCDFARVLARLAALGYRPRLSAWDPPGPGREPGDDTKKPGFIVPLCGANYVRPRPNRPPVPPNHSPTPQADESLPPRQGSGPVTTTPARLPREPADMPMSDPNPRTNGEAALLSPRSAATQPPQAEARPNPPVGDAAALSRALQITRESMASLLRVQEQTAQLHRRFLEGQENAQRTVHLLAEQQQRLLQVSLGLPVSSTPPVAIPASLPATPPPPPPPEPLPPPPIAAPTPVVRAPLAEPAAASNGPLEGILLAVVSEKTGYPAETLELDMALDADLGIDSIKRVEILAALQERLPGAPAVKPEHLGSLLTLRHVADFLAGGGRERGSVREWEREREGAPDDALPRSHAPTLSHSHSPTLSREAGRVEDLLLAVVSEKTGYPAETLELDMALDADLGIDSIKRVEILAALQERLPGAPAVKPEHLGSLLTLRHVADFLAGGGRERGGVRAWESERVEEQPGAPTLPPSHAPTPPIAPVTTLDRSVLQLAPLATPTAREPLCLPSGTEVWVVSEEDDLAPCLARRLRQLGFTPRSLPVEALKDQPPPTLLGGLIVIAPVGGAGDGFLKDALFGLRRVAAGLRQSGRQGAAVFVTVSRLDGAFGLSGLDAAREPVNGGLAGLAKTVGREWPEVKSKAIDLAPDFADADEAAAILIEEAFLSGPVEVGVARAGRVSLEQIVQSLPSGSDAVPLQPGDLVVVSGGARGVTAEVAVALARAYRPTLLLLGRSPLPEREPDWLLPLVTEAEIKRELGQRANGNATPKRIGEQFRQVTAQREVRQTLARVEAEGARVLYRAVDVRDAAAVAAVLQPLREEFGPVRGLVHGAGVLADALIEDKTPEQFDRVYSTKVDGLRALLRGLTPDDLRFLVLFSSISGRFGRKGQVDYAVANEVLNKIARQQSRRLPNCRVVSVNWGPWDGGMVTPALKKLFEREGVGLIAPREGADYLVKEISQTADRAVEVVVLAPEGARTADRALPGGGTAAEVGGRCTLAPQSPAGQECPTHRIPAQPLPVAFERTLDLADHPVLEAHVLDGRPVLPLALTLEWLAHGALHQNPGLAFHGCDDLQVLHGVILGERPPTVRVGAGKAVRKGDTFVAPVDLRGTHDGREVLHARAELVLVSDVPRLPAALPTPELRPYPRTIEEVYADLLFHGPLMQGIESVEGVGRQGIVARVRSSPAPAAWLRNALRQRWLADPLALDAGFQLVILWSLEHGGAPSLPCRVGRYRQYRKAFPADGVRLVVRLTRAGDLSAAADIDYLDAAGQVVARMEGYECAIDPGLRRAFSRRELVK
jgi:acyl transferase domain-containing protein/NADP-dependent 3-hydroxy acid dehydrogenase YdfG/acyl carrier protein